MLLDKLFDELDDKEVSKFSLTLAFLEDPAIIEELKQGPGFHRFLMRAKKYNWLHYTVLANQLGVSQSQVHRWFKPVGKTPEADEEFKKARSTPGKFTIQAATTVTRELLQEMRTNTVQKLDFD